MSSSAKSAFQNHYSKCLGRRVGRLKRRHIEQTPSLLTSTSAHAEVLKRTLRNLVTPAGKIERLEVPRDREGEFVTELFERYKRTTGDVEEAVLEVYLSANILVILRQRP